MPTALDMKVFVPTKDFEESLTFYLQLGWTKNWSDRSLAELELAGHRLFLQKYYNKDWANNFMMYIDVEDAKAWYDHILLVLEEHNLNTPV